MPKNSSPKSLIKFPAYLPGIHIAPPCGNPPNLGQLTYATYQHVMTSFWLAWSFGPDLPGMMTPETIHAHVSMSCLAPRFTKTHSPAINEDVFVIAPTGTVFFGAQTILGRTVDLMLMASGDEVMPVPKTMSVYQQFMGDREPGGVWRKHISPDAQLLNEAALKMDIF